MAVQEKIFDPENIKQAVESLNNVITAGSFLTNKDLLREYVTSDLFANYLNDNIIFDDYLKVTFEMIMAVEAESAQNRNVIVVVNSFKESLKGGRFNCGQSESWKLVERGDKWLLDEISGISVTDFY